MGAVCDLDWDERGDDVGFVSNIMFSRALLSLAMLAPGIDLPTEGEQLHGGSLQSPSRPVCFVQWRFAPIN